MMNAHRELPLLEGQADEGYVFLDLDLISPTQLQPTQPPPTNGSQAPTQPPFKRARSDQLPSEWPHDSADTHPDGAANSASTSTLRVKYFTKTFIATRGSQPVDGKVAGRRRWPGGAEKFLHICARIQRSGAAPEPRQYWYTSKRAFPVRGEPFVNGCAALIDVLIQSVGSDDVKASAMSLAVCGIIPVLMKIRSHRKKMAKAHNEADGLGKAASKETSQQRKKTS
ncbi:hypothetical protein FOZ60_002657 [Perkinsus olseni]|uniref:Uncharacterized protein n=1 Tax=Perkinsus olseni TaxID=32597 RepID=A0A7J6PIF7_PEROL|nr:hypothetical protein FOZ60_002657 [Perkinsus olseni]